MLFHWLHSSLRFHATRSASSGAVAQIAASVASAACGSGAHRSLAVDVCGCGWWLKGAGKVKKPCGPRRRIFAIAERKPRRVAGRWGGTFL